MTTQHTSAARQTAGPTARPTARHDAADIKARLQDRIESLLAVLLPDGQRGGGYWLSPSPLRGDRKKGTFWVSLHRNPGFWREESEDRKGDIFELIAICRGLSSFAEAIKWARQWLGLDAMTPYDQRREAEAARARLVAREKIRDARDVDLLSRQRGQAQARWIKSRERLAGSPVDTYLRTRGIALDKLVRIPGVLRYDPDGLHRETGELLPVMRLMMTLPDGKFGALHSTFLAPDGSGKADVTPARKIWPSFSGAAMRLARGKSGLDVMTACERKIEEPLVLCEGVEDGLSIALAAPELRVWAVGSLGNFAHQVLPSCCNEVIIAADNDWGKPQAAAAMRRAIDTLAQQGRPITLMRSHIGKDSNDALRGETS